MERYTTIGVVLGITLYSVLAFPITKWWLGVENLEGGDWFAFVGIALLLNIAGFLLFIRKVRTLHVATIGSPFTGLVATHHFHQGLNLSLPWWFKDREITLEFQKKKFKDDYYTKDKRVLEVEITFWWRAVEDRPKLIKLRNYLEAGNTLQDITELTERTLQGIATSLFKGMEDKEVWENRNTLNQKLATDIKQAKLYGIDSASVLTAQTIETAFGIDIATVLVSDLDYTEGSRKEAEKRAATEFQREYEEVMVNFTTEYVGRLKGKFPGLTDKEALDFLQVERGKITREIQEKKFDVGATLATAVDRAIAGIIARRGGQQPPPQGGNQ